MPSDYKRICLDNIREYGEGTRHLDFLGKLYADRTHFLFELLQNAEDAGATQLTFVLHKHQFDIFHDGRPFNEGDVRGVCGVGEGTKAEDMGKIGKFGIGFKSVYGYTCRPCIYSGAEAFAIEHYVRPVGLGTDDVCPPRPWTTIINLPFSEKVLAPDQAYREILKRLRSMTARTILFLRHLRTVEWRAGDEYGLFSRDFVQMGPARKEMAITERAGKEREECWLVFERPVQLPKGSRHLPSGEYEVFNRRLVLPSGKDALKVEVAFFLEQDQRKGDRIAVAPDSKLVAFFPTDKDTELGLLIQGLYATTPARDNIRLNDPWNEHLIAETAMLLVESLDALKGLGLLTAQALATLPLRPARFTNESPFRPIFDAVRTALGERPILPVQGGGFTAAREARLARGVGLIDLLSPQQLGRLLGTGSPIQWLSADISLDRTPDLYRYLVGRFEYGEDPEKLGALVERIEIRPEHVLAQLTPTFLEAQSDEWMIRLYSLFEPIRESDIRKSLATKEIIRLSNGRHVAAHGADGLPRVYLPSRLMLDTDVLTVKAEIARHDQALAFLKGLNLIEPNIATEVIERILPKYQAGQPAVAEATYEADVRNSPYAPANHIVCYTLFYDRRQDT